MCAFSFGHKFFFWNQKDFYFFFITHHYYVIEVGLLSLHNMPVDRGGKIGPELRTRHDMKRN